MKNYTYVFTFFKNPKNMTFYVFWLVAHVFSNTDLKSVNFSCEVGQPDWCEFNSTVDWLLQLTSVGSFGRLADAWMTARRSRHSSGTRLPVRAVLATTICRWCLTAHGRGPRTRPTCPPVSRPVSLLVVVKMERGTTSRVKSTPASSAKSTCSSLDTVKWHCRKNAGNTTRIYSRFNPLECSGVRQLVYS